MVSGFKQYSLFPSNKLDRKLLLDRFETNLIEIEDFLTYISFFISLQKIFQLCNSWRKSDKILSGLSRELFAGILKDAHFYSVSGISIDATIFQIQTPIEPIQKSLGQQEFDEKVALWQKRPWNFQNYVLAKFNFC